jgi:hypothetical protein
MDQNNQNNSNNNPIPNSENSLHPKTVVEVNRFKKIMPLFIILLIIVFIIFLVFQIVKISIQTANTIISSPTPTPIVMPTAVIEGRNYSSISTMSAYLDINSSIASLSSMIAETDLLDSSINPPVIDLQLGFSNL